MEHERAKSENTPEVSSSAERGREELRAVGDKVIIAAQTEDSTTALANDPTNSKIAQQPATARASHLGNVFIGDQSIPVRDPLPIALKTTDFTDLYKDSKIIPDTRKAEELRRKFELGEDEDDKTGDFYAKRFEWKLVVGIQTGRWLGNVGNNPDFTTVSYMSADYDDYIHRLDAFTTLTLKEPITRELRSGKTLKISQIPIAFDATVSTSSAKIEEKLTKMSNSGTDLPFGFTQIDYYTDSRRKRAVEYCPRYVIGISSRETKECVNDRDLKDTSCEPNANNTTMRFKVLSEMRAQNRLFQAMLPDKSVPEADKHKRIMRRNAQLLLGRMEEILTNGLEECAKINLNPASRVLSDRAREKVTAADDKVAAIEEAMIESSKMKFMFDYRNILGEDYDPNDPNEKSCDTYGKIVLMARKLTELAQNTTKLDQHKTIGKHHKRF